MFISVVSALQDQLKNVQPIQASGGAFAAIRGDGSVVTWGDGSVVTWGDSRRGRDGSAVQEQLRNVQQIRGCCSCFAAITVT